MKVIENSELLKNQIFAAEITGYTSEGNGVCRINGRAVFVPRALAGERWRIKILKVTKTAVYARGEELLDPSAERIEPDCPYFPGCGGCAMRHMSYAEELRMKLARVNDAFPRVGGLELRADEIVGAPEISGYRNKAIYAVGRGANGIERGYFKARSHEIIPISRCLLVPERADAIADAVVEWMERNEIPAYDEASGRGLVRHIFTRTSEDGGALLCVVAAGELALCRELIETVRARVPEVSGIVLNINKKRGNTVLTGEFKTLWDGGGIHEKLCGLDFRLSPRSFFQVNTAQAEVLYGIVRDFARPEGETLIDLYCGTGTIGLSMARDARRIIGAEVVPEAIEDARENATRNGIANAEFLCGDALDCARSLCERGERPGVIVVDPPRKGLAPGICEAVAGMEPKRVVYVSCDPATLARDLKIFEGLGYRAQRAVAVDMFPRTAHVECVVLMTKQWE